MNVKFNANFLRDLRKMHDKRLSASIQEIIEQVELATSLQDISNIKKLKGETGY